MIKGWQPCQNGIWKTLVPEVAAGRWYFEQLFVNGQRATRARTPNKFFFYLQDCREKLDAGQRKAAKGGRTDGPHAAGRRPPGIRQVRPQDDLRDVNLVVYHNWDNTRRFLDEIDTEARRIDDQRWGMKPWNPWRHNSHYVLENYLAALDSPGEWFLSRDGTLYYMPLPGEDMTKAEVIAPVAESSWSLHRATPAAGVRRTRRFSGLAFRHGQWLTPRSGFEPMQAAAQIEAVVMADAARHVTIENCEIGHVGTYALWFRHGLPRLCDPPLSIHDFGAGGVRIGETGIARDEARSTGQITVDNNIVRHGG